jgi:hypothetical protein
LSDIRILVEHEEHIHEVTTSTQVCFNSRVSEVLYVVQTGTYPCYAKDTQARREDLAKGQSDRVEF